MQPRSPSNVRIIDVSNVNGVIDWQQVARSGIVGVYDKVTEGATYHDARFVVNYEGAKSVGLLCGAYCFARPRTSSALDEANSFVASVNAHGGFAELPPMLDVEDNGGLDPEQIAKWIRVWFDRVHALTGIQPILYTYTAFAQKYLRGLTDLPIWIADYRGYAAPPDSGWTRWTMYQFTNVGHVRGIKGNCDISEFAGSYQDLLLFCKQRGVDLNMLKPGDSNHEAVKEMQKELLDVLHLDPKKFAVDGLYGPMTTAAVKSFQFQFKVGSQPGIADDATLSVLKQKYDAIHPIVKNPVDPVVTPVTPIVNAPQSIVDAENALLAAINAEKASAAAQIAQAQQQVADAQKRVQAMHDGVAQAENILKGVLN